MYHHELMQDVVDCQQLGPSAKLLLIVLARHTNDEGSCFPSLATLTKKTGLSRRTIQRQLNWCVDNGIIVRMNDKTVRSTRYQFTHLMEDNDIMAPKDNNKVVTLIQPIKNKLTYTPLGDIVTPPPEKDQCFQRFWEVYPRKVAKGYARKAFAKAASKCNPDLIVESAALFASQVRDKEMKFIPHPSTWLSGERWLDEVESIEGASNTQRLQSLMNVTPITINKKDDMSWP